MGYTTMAKVDTVIEVVKWEKDRYGFYNKVTHIIGGKHEVVMEHYWNALKNTDVCVVDIIPQHKLSQRQKNDMKII